MKIPTLYYTRTFIVFSTLLFFNDQRCPAPKDSTTSLRITQIIRDELKKTDGGKATIFTIGKVLEDPKAPVFTYYSTYQH